MNRCNSNCNNINDPYARICVPDIVKNLNVKVFNLMLRTNETKFIEWHETGQCKCRLNAIVCNNKQRWNKNKCRCEWKKLIDQRVCDKRFIWNRSNCECECDKSCNIGEYLDYSNYKCRKKLFSPLIEECTENTNETKLVENTLDENKNKYNSHVVYKVLFWTFFIFFIINLGIGIYFVYRKYVNRKYDSHY